MGFFGVCVVAAGPIGGALFVLYLWGDNDIVRYGMRAFIGLTVMGALCTQI